MVRAVLDLVLGLIFVEMLFQSLQYWLVGFGVAVR